jgi:hypothetical protein
MFAADGKYGQHFSEVCVYLYERTLDDGSADLQGYDQAYYHRE